MRYEFKNNISGFNILMGMFFKRATRHFMLVCEQWLFFIFFFLAATEIENDACLSIDRRALHCL